MPWLAYLIAPPPPPPVVWEPAEIPEAWSLDATLGATLPTDAGLRATFEGPARLRVRAGVGWMPGGWGEALADTLSAVAEPTAEEDYLMRAALERSWGAWGGLGWRPWADRGFWFSGGYRWTSLGGQINNQEVVAAGGDDELLEWMANRDFTMRSSLHMAQLEAGLEWVWLERVRARAGLGFQSTLSAATRIEPVNFAPLFDPDADPLIAEGRAYLDDFYEGSVHAPVISLELGYVFW